MQKKKRNLKPGDEEYERSRHWVVTQKELNRVFSLDRTANRHLSNGKKLTLEEFERMCRAAFAIVDTQEDRLMMWQRIGDKLFVNATDDEVQAPPPFQRSLVEVFKEQIDEKVREEVARQLRIEHYKRMSDAIK